MRGDFRPLPKKNLQIIDHFFPLLFPKDSESLKILDIQLQKVGEKRPLNGTSKVNKVREKKLFFYAAIFDNFQKKMFISETTSCHYFPQEFRISKNIGHPTSGSGGKKTIKRYLKSEKSEEEKNFFCAAIFNNFQTKMFISETTSFHYFSPRITNL